MKTYWLPMAFLLLCTAKADGEVTLMFIRNLNNDGVSLSATGSTKCSGVIKGRSMEVYFAPTEWFSRSVFHPVNGVQPADEAPATLSSNLTLSDTATGAVIASFNRIQGINSPSGDGWRLLAAEDFFLEGGAEVTLSGVGALGCTTPMKVTTIAPGSYKCLSQVGSLSEVKMQWSVGEFPVPAKSSSENPSVTTK